MVNRVRMTKIMSGAFGQSARSTKCSARLLNLSFAHHLVKCTLFGKMCNAFCQLHCTYDEQHPFAHYSEWQNFKYLKNHMLAIILCVIIELKDCLMSQAVTYAKKVLISWKQCKIGTQLLQTTNRKWYNPIELCHRKWSWTTLKVI